MNYLPKHLSNPDYYFRKFESCIDMENIKAESDSEKTYRDQTIEEIDQQLKNQIDNKIRNLNTRLDTMNDALSTITTALQNDLKASVQFFNKVNKSA